MVQTTRQQRVALGKLYERIDPQTSPFLSYRGFRASIHPMLGGNGAIVVRWCGMWIAIELDGHSHS